ncbi:hypothetical protein ILYODFUR_016434 [Ilyodon furcidens]|uniref:Uncharacterized protein n=1 Tax=Ilyodon furcidens TaxID=33524 RepID=A0ABV0U5V3_9TELE
MAFIITAVAGLLDSFSAGPRHCRRRRPPRSTVGFFVAVLLVGCSKGPLLCSAGLLAIRLNSVSARDDLRAARLNSVSAWDDLWTARLNSGFCIGQPLGRPPELCFVFGPAFAQVAFLILALFWVLFCFF